MARQKSEHAMAAAAIRKEFKAIGVPVRASSEVYAGGSSVRVRVPVMGHKSRDVLNGISGKYQEGHFDGMVDMYEYSNVNADLPQVKFVFVECDMGSYSAINELNEQLKVHVRKLIDIDDDRDAYRWINEFIMDDRDELEKFASDHGYAVKGAGEVFWIEAA